MNLVQRETSGFQRSYSVEKYTPAFGIVSLQLISPVRHSSPLAIEFGSPTLGGSSALAQLKHCDSLSSAPRRARWSALELEVSLILGRSGERRDGSSAPDTAIRFSQAQSADLYEYCDLAGLDCSAQDLTIFESTSSDEAS